MYYAARSRGSHAGINYEIRGSGPALVLAPLDIAGSQWDPIIRRLAENFTVITISGRHLALVELFEERATQPSCAGMIYNLFDVIDPEQGDSILDVGCGSGAIDRLLARRFGDANLFRAVAASAACLLLKTNVFH